MYSKVSMCDTIDNASFSFRGEYRDTASSLEEAACLRHFKF